MLPQQALNLSERTSLTENSSPESVGISRNSTSTRPSGVSSNYQTEAPPGNNLRETAEEPGGGTLGDLSLTIITRQPSAPKIAGPVGRGSQDEEPLRPQPPQEGGRPRSSLPLKESLGLGGSVTIFGGHIGILAILGFFAFLWFGYGPSPEAARATRGWRQIALHNWMTQTITLSALVLRFIVSLQAAVCTSMIASLVLEKRFVRRSQASHFSILRGINDGPMKLLGLMVSSKLAIFAFVEFWLLLFVFLVTLALQFSSTILLFDLREFIIVGDTAQMHVPSLLTYNGGDLHVAAYQGFLSQMPLYQMFAEAPSASDATPNAHGLSDTGVVQRGLLPQAERDDRIALRQFNGNLMIMNSRVVCVRPVMETIYETETVAPDSQVQFLKGRLHYVKTLEMAGVPAQSLCLTPECREVPFECSIPLTADNTWESADCIVGGVGGKWWDLDFNPKWEPNEEPWSPNSTIHLIFTTNLGATDWAVLPETGSLGSSEVYGEWLSFELAAGRRLNASVCFAAFNMERKLVHVSAERTLREPETNWSVTSTKYDTADVQRFFGVDLPRRPHGERKILTMHVIGQPNDGPAGSPAYNIISTPGDFGPVSNTLADLTTRLLEFLVGYELSDAQLSNSSILLCYTCLGWGNAQHPILGMLFTSIIAETGRAANAISSYMTVIASTWYDAYRNSIQEMQKATVITTISVLTPGPCDSKNSCGGFYTVVALVVVHLSYVAIITALFARQIQHSRLNNIWHTVSQLLAEELSTILRKANDANDHSVESYLKTHGDDCVKLERVSDTGRVEIVGLPAKSTTGTGTKNRVVIRGKPSMVQIEVPGHDVGTVANSGIPSGRVTW